MFLTVLAGFSLLISFIWAVFLLQRVLNFRNSTPTRTTQNYTVKDKKLALALEFEQEKVIKQLLPACSSKSWQLQRCHHSLRIWRLHTQSNHYLHACSLRIKCSAHNLLNYLRQPSLFGEWRAGVRSVEMMSETERDQVICWRQPKYGHRLGLEDNLLTWWLEPILEQEMTVQRKFITDDQYGRVIEQYGTSGCSVYILQPIIALETDQCRLTVITTGDGLTIAEECQSIGEYYMMKRTPVDLHIASESSMSLPNGYENETPSRLNINNSHAKKIIPETTEETTGLHSSEDRGLPAQTHTDSSQKVVQIEVTKPLSSHDEAGVESEDAAPQAASTPSKVSIPRLVRMASERPASRPTLGTIPQSQSLGGLSPRVVEVRGIGSVSLLRSPGSEQKGLVDYKTLANKCAGELIAEVHDAANIVQRPKDRDELPAGWVFHSTDRDVAMLLKNVPAQKTQSWLGKGLLKCRPEVVWQAVSSPYTRYIHDEMMKELTVISDLGDGMKLLKLLYSTSQLLRRDSREFYLLQAERREKKKTILTLCSVDWPEPENKDCPRGTFDATGWIIEPVTSKNNHTYSMVTYLSSIDLGPLDTPGVQQFQEEFIIKQPNAIADLRDYLTLPE